ncbi:MAG: D-alanyl-D-alanine carboxypeptidase [Rhodospirillales bacterium]|nr:D-alanyl-D-alanine carboxypeptidase [Rhodospirillales bacterium]MSP81229.1 D-alanyl-D-alanine carboxypeptidase [Rhodospirillales bacterium]
MTAAALRALGLVLLLAAVSPGAPPASANETIAREAILVDFDTGQVLFEKDADKRIPPASMSKIMTAYLVYRRLAEGRLALEDTFSVSENAWRKGGAKSGGSTMFLNPGERVKAVDLLRGVVVQSGNDACIVLAEGLAQSERAFADEMTALGKSIGLKDSVFTNTTGWPDPDHHMTARDLALLSIRLIRDFPEHYKVYAERTFAYNGITQGNRNPLLYKDLGVDGIKTGHTQEAGYSLTVSARRGSRRLILAVTGLKSMNERGREAERLLEWGFREFNNYALFKAGEQIGEAEVWLGQDAKVPLVIGGDLILTLPRAARRNMKVKLGYQGPIAAPIAKGEILATLTVTVPDRAPLEIPLVAGEPVERLGLTGRLKAAFRHILWGEAG